MRRKPTNCTVISLFNTAFTFEFFSFIYLELPGLDVLSNVFKIEHHKGGVSLYISKRFQYKVYLNQLLFDILVVEVFVENSEVTVEVVYALARLILLYFCFL